MNKTISNIGVLDVRKVTKEMAGELQLINNVGTLITNQESELILKDVNKNNIGSVIKTDKKISIVKVNNHMLLEAGDLEAMDDNLMLRINGTLVLSKNIDPMMFKEKVFDGSVNGLVVIPSNLSGVVKNKLKVNGSLVVYNAEMTYLNQNIELNKEFLETYFGDRKVSVNKFVSLEELDISEFTELFDKIEVLGDCVITKENLMKLKPYLEIKQDKITILKPPVKYYMHDIELDDSVLEASKGKHIVVRKQLTIRNAELLDQLGEFKVSAGKVLCHKSDRDKVKSKCLDESQVIEFIEDMPINNYSDMVINQSYLSSLGKMQVISNYGDMFFDEDININEPCLLQIKNYGTIQSPKTLDGYVRKAIIENYGDLVNEVKDDKDINVMYENMGYLEL